MDPILKNIVRIGVVSSVNAEKCAARVIFESQNTVSDEIPIIVRGSLNTNDYWLPEVGDQVLCISLPNGNAQGYILGTFYSEVDKPKVNNKNKRQIAFEDGTIIEYDKSSSALTINAVGPVNIKANGINIEGDVTVVGGITTTNDVVANNISLQQHVHCDVMSGPSQTGKPVGGS